MVKVCVFSFLQHSWVHAISLMLIYKAFCFTERPEIDFVSKDQDVCEDSVVTLSCIATGKPTPNINWTRVWENGTDSEPLPVVDGSYVVSNIRRSSNGTYRCTAYNGVGDPVNRTVKVIVGCKCTSV